MGKAAPQAKIMLDRERTMRMDLNAMEAFEDMAGKQIHEMGDTPKIKDLKVLVWATLLHEDETLTPQQVGTFIHAGNLVNITQAINELTTKND